MKSQLKDSLSNIRDAWTEEERRERKELAGVMQLQLRRRNIDSHTGSNQQRPRLAK